MGAMSGPPSKISALLVEDDARLGSMVAEYLGRHEIDVTVVGDGERGLTALRRRGGPRAPRTRFTAGGLSVDFDAREVTVDGRRVVLTHHEFELLAALARAAGRVLSREQLMDALKGQDYEAFDRSIDVHVSKLRAKIEKDARAPRYIKTVRGVGYALVRPGPAR